VAYLKKANVRLDRVNLVPHIGTALTLMSRGMDRIALALEPLLQADVVDVGYMSGARCHHRRRWRWPNAFAAVLNKPPSRTLE